LHDAPELEDRLLRQQEQWQQQVVLLLDRLITHHTAAGAFDRALPYARRLVALEPWREEAHCQAMVLLARTGQISAALAQYQTCRRALWSELAVEPAQSTRALYRRLQSSVQQLRRTVPLPMTPLVGRTEEVAHLIRLLAPPYCRLVTLVGVGGIGKSRLALAVAQTVNRADLRMFLHGVVFVPLAGVDGAAQMVVTVAQALGFSLLGRDPPATQLCSYLRDKELLLVLDNVEQLIDDESLHVLLHLLEAAPEVKLLVTSRARLGLHCEQLYWLQGLQLPTTADTTLTPATARDFSALQLWIETVRRQRSDYVVTTDELPVLVTIGRQVQGLPLAIELAAAWRSELSPAAIAAELAANLDFLATNAPDLPPRQRSMRAVYQTSWRLLTPVEQALFPLLAVFRGGFTAPLAQTVAAVDAALLHALLDRSLVSPAGEGRYILHELTRQFAAEQLAATEQLYTIRRRHALAFLAYIAQLAPHSRYTGSRPGLDAISADYENIEAALRWCFTEGEAALGVALVAALRDFWQLTNQWREGCKWQEAALAMPFTAKTQLRRAIVLNEYGVLLGLMGEISRAQAAHEESLRLFELLGAANERAWTLHHLACPEYQDGDDALCNAMLSTALTTFRQTRDERGIAHTLQRLTIQMLDGDEDLVRAEAFANESLAIARRLDARSGMAGTLILLGEIRIRQEDFTSAANYLNKSLALSAPSSGLRSWALGKLGRVFLKQGKVVNAQTAFQEALHIRQELGSIIGVAWMLEALGEVAVAAQKYARAVQMFGAAATLRTDHGQPLLAVDKRTFDDLLVKTRAALGAERFTAAWQQGEQLAREQTDFAALFGWADAATQH
jgi:predicted ATPase/Tfp pilus assembly protein PilF